MVRIGLAGQPYIEVIEGEMVEGLPPGVVLQVRRTGTILGLDEELMVGEDGTLYFLDRKSGYFTCFSVDPEEVAQVLNQVGGYLSAGEVGTPIPDTAVYRFTVWDGEAVRTLRVFEWESPLAEAVGIVARWCDQGGGGWERPDIPGVVTDTSPPGESESPLPEPGGTPLSPLPRPPLEITDVVVSYLAARLGVSPDEISVLSIEPAQWRDTSLGCPQPGMMYAQVIVPGYRAILEVGGKQYEVHTDEQGQRMVTCSGEDEE